VTGQTGQIQVVAVNMDIKLVSPSLVTLLSPRSQRAVRAARLQASSDYLQDSNNYPEE
jgi:hypothetical protein